MKLSHRNENLARKVAVTFAFSALAFSVSSGAEEQQLAYTMSAITNASFGSKVTDGAYDHAISKITAPGFNRKASFESNTNLCVAYTKTGSLEEATASCDAALDTVRTRLRSGATVDYTTLAAQGISRSDLALALSNRGVLYAVQGEKDLARQVFVEAIDLKTGLAAPKTNLARLEIDTGAETFSAN